MNITAATYKELQEEIICNNDGLYEQFNEEKFLNDEYTLEELKSITSNWIINNNEAK